MKFRPVTVYKATGRQIETNRKGRRWERNNQHLLCDRLILSLSLSLSLSLNHPPSLFTFDFPHYSLLSTRPWVKGLVSLYIYPIPQIYRTLRNCLLVFSVTSQRGRLCICLKGNISRLGHHFLLFETLFRSRYSEIIEGRKKSDIHA